MGQRILRGSAFRTDVPISANTEVNGIIFTSAATNPYTITASARLRLTISGIGITANSGITQNFIAAAGKNGAIRQIAFTNSASAGNANILSEGGSVQFSNRSSVSSANITNEDYGTNKLFR